MAFFTAPRSSHPHHRPRGGAGGRFAAVRRLLLPLLLVPVVLTTIVLQHQHRGVRALAASALSVERRSSFRIAASARAVPHSGKRTQPTPTTTAHSRSPLLRRHHSGNNKQQLPATTSLRLSAADSDPDQNEPSAAAATTTGTTAAAAAAAQDDPQVFSSGYSTRGNLLEALQEAVTVACAGLPRGCAAVDLGTVTVSSLYDGGSVAPAAVTVPAVLAAAQNLGVDVRHLVGCSAAGVIASTTVSTRGGAPSSCRPVELEAVPAVAVTLMVLPDCRLTVFHVAAPDLPEAGTRQTTPQEWKRAVGLSGMPTATATDDTNSPPPPLFWLIPSPAFSTDLDDLLQGLQHHFPGCQIAGGVASTVSSLSRAKLFAYSKDNSGQEVCFADGCVGVGLAGDVALRSLTAQGAKPVGGIYQILKGQGSSIQVIVLDERATEALKEDDEDGDDDDDDDEDEDEEEETPKTPQDARAAMAQFYAKAQIPKPVLAEANFLMRTLSDDDRAFMRRQLLVGLERGGSVGRTAGELARLAAGRGHRFAVHAVASAGMKDGSITLPLGRADVRPGTRLRFFVREPDFARREVEALWTGYKKRLLDEQFATSSGSSSSSSDGDGDGDGDVKDVAKPAFTPGCCFLIPTLDRGSKFFQNSKAGYESATAARALPGVPCISGFFSNGVIGQVDSGSGSGDEDAAPASGNVGVQGSASGYFLLGSRSGRPVYSPARAAADQAALEEERAAAQARADLRDAEDAKRTARTKAFASNDGGDQRAPRSEDGELIIKRREVHSGRSLTVSTVEWSVAEKMAKPSSALEGFMWDKETEVDRFRERVPLANLVSQCRLSVADPKAPKPRDWVGPVKRAARETGFVIVPECKRSDPATGSLRRRYDLTQLVKDFTKGGVPAMSVNCDAIFFGGTIDHITEARTASSQAAVEDISEDGVVVPPILASDLLLYPYQLYKLRLAGADAVNLVGGALASKDLLYLTKISASLQLQTLVTVTSEVQIEQLNALSAGSFDGVIISNRELEDFSFDETGEQALLMLKSDALKRLKETHGDDLLVLVEGRIGIIERTDEDGITSCNQYLKELKAAGAMGAIVGGGLAISSSSDSNQTLLKLQSATAN